MQLELKELVPYMLNGGTYSDIVNKEVGFVTRIYGGYFHGGALDAQKELKAGDTVVMKKDPTNKYDVNATEIRNLNGEFLGFLRKEIAAEIKDVNNFKVQVKNPYDGSTTGNKNSVGTEIIIVNLAEFKKINEENEK